jgi:hypothetical protein
VVEDHTWRMVDGVQKRHTVYVDFGFAIDHKGTGRPSIAERYLRSCLGVFDGKA